jgi:UDP-N-acetylmuramate dehydrogenase
MNALEHSLREFFGVRLRVNYPLAAETSFRIGGPADLFLIVEDSRELGLAKTAAFHHSAPTFCLGSGTNLLVSDRGIRGLVLKLGAGFSRIEIDGCNVRAGAAAQFGELAETTAGQALAGLEFGEGIPGSVGGGLVMNAGAFGGEIARVVVAIHGIQASGRPRSLNRDEAGFSYRRSALPPGFVITEVEFKLTPGNREILRARIDEIHKRRASRQPRTEPNAGSVFKNPPGGFAGKLLEEAGLKGERLGSAAFSTQHANFIVNLGGATACEVHSLIELARARVHQTAGVMLEPEVRLVGEW